MGFRTSVYTEGDFELKTVWADDITIVQLESGGFKGRGTAKWNPDDVYDPDFGEALAKMRAINRWSAKAVKALVKSA